MQFPVLSTTANNVRVTQAVLSESEPDGASRETDIRVMTQGATHYWMLLPGSRITIHIGEATHTYHVKPTVTNNLVS